MSNEKNTNEMNANEINKIYSQVFGGEASYDEKKKSVSNHIAEHGYKATKNALSYSESIIYFGEVSDGQHDF